jgi:polar amino acid transport system substrate-binding protein/glutamate/aspartate transport system substrate-binding protein
MSERSKKMKGKKGVTLVLGAAFLLGSLSMAATSYSESVLDKIERTGKITIGHREGAIPFGFYDKKGNWGGFSMDVGKLLAGELEKKFNKPIKYIAKPVNPKTRIPLVANRTIDIVMGSTTITLARDKVIDFSIPFFVTGTRLLVPKGSPIKDFPDLAGKRVGVARGASANIKGLRNAIEEGLINPPCDIVLFDDHTKGFLALKQGKTHAHFTDASLLAGLKQKAPNPDNWEIVGRLLTYEPYGFIIIENDSDWRDFVNAFMIHLIKSGEFYKIYDKWMGPNGEVPIPMSTEFKTFLMVQSFPE